jgi:hypothetical protein
VLALASVGSAPSAHAGGSGGSGGSARMSADAEPAAGHEAAGEVSASPGSA